MGKKEIETLSSRIAYSNRWMKVREDEIRRADGSLGLYGVVEKKDFALIVPKRDGHLVLVEQYRYPVEERYWEFPQGSWEARDIGPEDLARAELKEETGLLAEKIESVGYLYQAYGYSSQGCAIFLATGLTESEKELEPEEQGMLSREFSIGEVEDMIVGNAIRDSATVSAFCLLRLKSLL